MQQSFWEGFFFQFINLPFFSLSTPEMDGAI